MSRVKMLMGGVAVAAVVGVGAFAALHFGHSAQAADHGANAAPGQCPPPPAGGTGPQGPSGTSGPRGPRGQGGPNGATGPGGPQGQGVQPSGATGPGGAPHDGKCGPMGMRGGFGFGDVFGAAATKLGITQDQLMQELKSGKSLAQVGSAHGVSRDDLKAALIASSKAGIQSALSSGKMTQDQANNATSGLESRIDGLLDRTGGPGGGPKGQHGPRPNGAPPAGAPQGGSTSQQ